ncbi:MAG TPA: universal stress protein [Candidatus Binatia bacterium]|nr:universal stress protein [Candidatus Binatia bacterium]
MEKLNKILAPTDLSELSCVGVRYALDLARSQNAEVIVYHVLEVSDGWTAKRQDFGPVSEMLARQQQTLDRFVREKFADRIDLVKVRQDVELGGAWHNIIEKAKREAIDMIVMSTHGRTGLDHLLMGSVSEKVVGRAPCPVLIVPAHDRAAAISKASNVA